MTLISPFKNTLSPDGLAMFFKNRKKAAIVIVVLMLAGLFFLLGLHRYLTLSFIKESMDGFRELYAQRPFLVSASFFLLYTMVTALSLPGAAIMTLAGGALFGFWTGLVITSFASSIGATFACFFARYVFRDWVSDRFGDRLNKINEGIVEEGAFYLFTLRLIPAIPFFVINLVMGLTPMRLRTFYWVSQLGMLPGAMVYINAGRELGRIDSAGSILSPSLIISFTILGLFPLVAKKTIAFYRSRHGKRA